MSTNRIGTYQWWEWNARADDANAIDCKPPAKWWEWNSRADDAEFHEEDHPRAEDGKFTTGAGGSSSGTESEQEPAQATAVAPPTPTEAAATPKGAAPAVAHYDPFNADPAKRSPVGVSAEKLNVVVDHLNGLVKELGYNPDKVHVRWDNPKFTLNGRQHSYAGYAEIDKKEITLFPEQLTSASAKGLIAHEIEHCKFQTALDVLSKERKAIIDAADGGGDMAVSPSGALIKGYEDKYPVYAKLQLLLQGDAKTALIKKDGVTDYSREWWQAYNDKKATFYQATHETLAEIANIKATTGKLAGSPEWRKLYRAVNEVYEDAAESAEAVQSTAAKAPIQPRSPNVEHLLGYNKKPTEVASSLRNSYSSSTSEDEVLRKFDSQTRETIDKRRNDIKAAVQRGEETTTKFKTKTDEGREVYTQERRAIHRKVLAEIFDPAKIEAARPEAGKKPTAYFLGGRGGSGKSQFKGAVYDPEKTVVIDPDSIKELLGKHGGGYEGWNAYLFHEESSDLTKRALANARKLGINVAIDQTMSSDPKKKIEEFKNSGYRTEGHYMFLPEEMAAERAIGRFKTSKGDFSGRFVPPEVVLSSKSNEANFDQNTPIFDDWSVWRNDVSKGEHAKMVGHKEVTL